MSRSVWSGKDMAAGGTALQFVSVMVESIMEAGSCNLGHAGCEYRRSSSNVFAFMPHAGSYAGFNCKALEQAFTFLSESVSPNAEATQ